MWNWNNDSKYEYTKAMKSKACNKGNHGEMHFQRDRRIY